MAITPYSPIGEQPLINTYVPLPYDDLLKAGLSKQAQYNAGEAGVDENENFLKVQALREEEDLRNQLVDKYKTELTAQVEKAGGDYAKVLPFVKQQARRIKEDLDRGQLGSIDKAAKAYQAAEADFAKRDALGDFQGLSDEAKYVMLEQAKQDYLTKGGSRTPVNGTYNQFRPNALGKFSDWATEASQFAQQWAFDSGVGNIKRANNEFYKIVDNKWVKAPEVDNAVQEFLRNNTKYSQQRGAIESYYDTQGQGLGKQKLNEVISGIAGPIAERESFNQQDARYMADPTAGARARIAYDKEKDKVKYLTTNTSITTNQNSNPLKGTKLESYWDNNLKFTDKGNPLFKSNNTAKWSGSVEIVKGADGKYKALKQGSVSDIDVAKTQEFAKAINEYQDKVPAFRNMTPQQITGALAQANKNSFAYSTELHDPINIDKKQLDDMLIRHVKSNDVTLSLTGDYSGEKTNKQVLEELGMSSDELSATIEKLKSASINPAKGGFTVTLPNKDGNPVSVDISGFSQLDSKFGTIKEIAKAEAKGDIGTKTINTNGAKVTISTNLVPNSSTGEWNYVSSAKEERTYNKENSKVLLKNLSSTGKSVNQLQEEGSIKLNNDGTVTLVKYITNPRDEAYNLSVEVGEESLQNMRQGEKKEYVEAE